MWSWACDANFLAVHFGWRTLVRHPKNEQPKSLHHTLMTTCPIQVIYYIYIFPLFQFFSNCYKCWTLTKNVFLHINCKGLRGGCPIERKAQTTPSLPGNQSIAKTNKQTNKKNSSHVNVQLFGDNVSLTKRFNVKRFLCLFNENDIW